MAEWAHSFGPVQGSQLSSRAAEVASPRPTVTACSNSQHSLPGYDRLPEFRWEFVPLWGIPTHFLSAPRRVQCGEHGVVAEHIPWRAEKRPLTTDMMGFLARWTRRLGWSETARVFGTSWESVYRSVEWYVEYGLLNRQVSSVEAIGGGTRFTGDTARRRITS
jgi:transposase